MKKIAFSVICGVIISQSVLASNSVDFIHPFIEGEIGITVNSQHMDVAEREYSIPYSTFSANLASNSVDFIHPFIGGEIGITVNNQHMDVAEREYSIPYSTFSANNPNFTYGVNAGVRLLDDSHIFHPGFQAFYNGIIGSGNLNVANPYGSTDFELDATHNLYGCEFDNYIRMVHNEKSDIFKGDEMNGYIVFGLDVGKIKSKYTISLSGTDYNIKDDGTFYGAKIEYVAENTKGLGLTIGMKLLKTNTDALSTVLITRWGLRYTF